MPRKGMGSSSCFIFSLLVALSYLIASCLILWTSSSPPTGGTSEATNGNTPSQAHHHHPRRYSEEACHHLPPGLFSAASPACPGAGEAPASEGNIGCQGDSQDEASLELFAWAVTCLLAYFLVRCAKLAWIMFVLMVWTLCEVKRRARRPHPPAPVQGDNDMEGAPENLVELAPGALPLSLTPPAPLPGRSISAPARLISTPVVVVAAANEW